MINKILIRTSDRKTLHKDRRSLGMSGENLQEVLLFCLDEKIEGNGIAEVELPDGTKGMIEVDRTEEGYELPVKSSLLTQTGFVKFQLRILHDNEEIFKSEIIPLEVKDSINATATIPEEYHSWIDNLTTLKQELEKAESERVSNENERQSAEKTRQENFTKMQETVSNAVSNIKDLTEEYNSNAKKETKKFNDNAVDQTKTFNDNSDSKLAEYNKNHTDKIKEYDDNGKAKLDEYNENDADKTNAYNDNTVLKEKAFNDIVTESTEVFNTNVEQKETEFEDLAEEKINEYNQVSAELTAKVKQVQAENESLKAENKLIKEQIPSATASGNNIHIEDSGSLDFEWKIRGGHKQKTREGYNLLDLSNFITQTKNGVTVVKNEDGSIKATGTNTSDSIISFDLATTNISSGDYVVSGVFGGSSSTYKMDIAEKGVRSYASSRDGAKDFTIEKDIEATAILYVYPNISINTVIYPMLYKGTDMDKPFEQYGASPSPDYPSEIETVGDNLNLLDIDKTTYDLTINLQKEGEYLKGNNVNLIRIGTWSNSIPQIEEKLKSGNYTISYEVKANSNVTILNLYLCVIYEDDTQENVGSSKGYSLEEGTKQKVFWTLNVQKNVKKMGIVSYLSNSCDIIVSKVKIEKGLIATPYSPYNQGSVEVKVINKNWLTNFENINNTNSGITMVGNKDNVKVTGTATKDWVSSNYAELENLQAGNYIFSYSSEQGLRYKIWIYNSEKSAIIYNLGLNQKISVPQNYKKLFFRIILENLTAGQIVNDTAYFQIEKGSTSTDIVEHQSQTAIMPVQQEMLEGDYVSNVEHHEWGKVVFTGEENWNMLYGAGMFHITNLIRVKDINPRTSISNYFKYNIANNGIYTNLKDGEFAVQYYEGNTTLYIKYLSISTVEEFKTWLKSKYEAGTPVTIYYKLATPVDLELTEEQKAIRDTKLYTYKNITNIAVSDELASIDVTYKKDLETEHNKLQKEIDEIKQLISTTETSALLLDNLQKDVESEVE